MSIPLIDLNNFLRAAVSARKDTAEIVDSALRDNGFLLLQGHGVREELIDNMRKISREFFALPHNEKMQVASPDRSVMRGYFAMRQEGLSYSVDQTAPPDLNESFMIGQPDTDKMDRPFAVNLWPQQPASLRDLWTEYYREMEIVAAGLMQLFAVALNLPEHFFDEKLVAHASRLRARYYPSQPEQPEPGQLRAGAHTDYGTVSILVTEDRPGGLQVCRRSGHWLDVPIIEGCFIVNIGDLMARWTNDRWPAALHRVVNPPRERAADCERLSMIFFQSPSEDVLIECLSVCSNASTPPKYPPVLAGEHQRTKFNKASISKEEAHDHSQS